MGTTHLGELEHMILLAVVRLGPDAYGMSVLRELEERAGRTVSRGGLYLVLERMVQKGYLATRMSDATPTRGGRAKRYFELTDDGREALRISGRAVLALWDGLEHLLDDAR
ncbi:MAG: helix-turn-helix transcriptional regulator [Longimicrobiales bacterium]